MEENNSVMTIRKSKFKCSKIVWLVFYVMLALIFIFPFIFLINKSLMTGKEASLIPVHFFPETLNFMAYYRIFTEGSYLLWTFNTLKIVIFNMIAVPLSASLVAYSFAKIKYKGKNVLFVLMLSTMLLPAVVVQIPQYIMFVAFGWNNSALPLTIPNLLGGGAINIFLLRQFMRSIPNDLDNAARIDGANVLKRFLLINLPLCKPVLIYVMITVFNTYWSDFYGPLVYLKTPEQYTLAIGIFRDSVINSTVDSLPTRMAAGVFMTIFPATLFFIFQKQLIEGVTVTGLKG